MGFADKLGARELSRLWDFPIRGSNTKSVNTYPWDVDEYMWDDAFWKPLNIQPDRWNKMFPYRLMVIDVNDGNKVVGGDITDVTTHTEVSEKEDVILVSQHINVSKNWIVQLPITPKQLSISTPFAINTTASMRGVVEEHSGVRFKIITASGTTGVWPHRPTLGKAPKNEGGIVGNLKSVFGGTIEAFGGLSDSVSSVANAFQGKHPSNLAPAVTPYQSEEGEESTGYYQALYLGEFLDRYAQARKRPENKGWRLVFDIPKQNKSFIVTPVNFNLNQTEARPNEILFNFQLKAWKRIQLDAPAPIEINVPKIGDANLFQRILGTLSATRRLLGQAMNLIKAVRSDFQKVFDILRQVTLAIKDIMGVIYAVGDLPKQIVEDLKSTIEDAAFNLKTTFNREPIEGPSGGSNTTPPAIPLRASSSAQKAGAAVNAIVAKKSINEGLSSQAVADGALGKNASNALDTDPMQTIFENPEENFDLFDGINVDDVQVSSEQQYAIDDEIERVRLINLNDLKGYRQEVLNLALDISNNYGAGNETYNSVYGRPDPKSRAIDMTIEENEVLVALMETVSSFDLLTSTLTWDDLKYESPLQFVGGLANESEIEFDTPESKMLVPVPYGSTIEEIAARYLGDPDKWLEIATINGLRSPYIDEDGFSYNLLSNGDGRQFNVADDEEQIYIGQKITLRSSTVSTFTRTVTDVEKIGTGNYLITVDGLDDLDVLTTLDGSSMTGYLPGTTNSQNQIYIPVDKAAPSDDRIQEISHLDSPMLNKISKVDWLLTEAGDVALNSVGDFRLSHGLNNLVQAMKLKIKTKKGSLLRHLDYGLGLEHGVSISDITTGKIIKSLNKMIEDDPRFSSINRLEIKLSGVTLAIDMSVSIVNSTGIVPISFNIKI